MRWQSIVKLTMFLVTMYYISYENMYHYKVDGWTGTWRQWRGKLKYF